MDESYASLSEKEKETLRLMVRGHDAKSMARELSLSVHTINDRLRAARRKLGVTSSREAARLVLEQEGSIPENLADKELGSAAGDTTSDGPTVLGKWSRAGRNIYSIGVILMIAIFAAMALATQSWAPQSASSDGSQDAEAPAAPNASSDAIIERASREWLALVDKGDWQASFDATGESFREVNTLEGWTAASLQAREPLGSVISRETVEIKYVNAPPRGYRSIAFFTKFSGGSEAIEMVTLEREGAGWRVVGYVIE